MNVPILLLLCPSIACSVADRETSTAQSGDSASRSSGGETWKSNDTAADSSAAPSESGAGVTDTSSAKDETPSNSSATDADGAGGASAPSGTSAIAPQGATCVSITRFSDEVATVCYEWEVDHNGIPNTQQTSFSSISLPEPTVAGQTYAITLNLQASENTQVELWGATESCGEAEALLWYASPVNGTICAEFTPPDAYSKLIMVWRDLRGDRTVWWDSVTFCPESCGENASGVGLAAGSPPLAAPIGPFEGKGRIALGPLDASLPVLDGYLRVRGPEEALVGQRVPLDAAYFRFNEDYDQPFSDAWYCAGEDSWFTLLEEETDDLHDWASFEFENITELARCPAEPGPHHLNFVVANPRQITDVDTDLNGFSTETATVNLSGCERANDYGYCMLHIETEPETKVFGYTVPGEADANGVLMFRDLAVIQMTESGPRAVCAAAGKLTYLDDNFMGFELSGVTDWQTCPQGKPANPSSFYGELEF